MSVLKVVVISFLKGTAPIMAVEAARVHFRAQLNEKLLLPRIWSLMLRQQARAAPREGVHHEAERVGVEASHIIRQVSVGRSNHQFSLLSVKPPSITRVGSAESLARSRAASISLASSAPKPNSTFSMNIPRILHRSS